MTTIAGWGKLPTPEPRVHRVYRRYFVLSDGRTVTASQLSRDPDNIHGLHRNTLRSRLLRGWTAREELLQPLCKRGRKMRTARQEIK